MQYLKRRLVAVAIVVGLGSSACASHVPPSLTTQEARTAYTADEIIKRIGEVQQVVIDSADSGKISVADGRRVVSWTKAVIAGITETPNGWKATALKTYPDVRKVLNRTTYLQPYIAVLDSLVGYQGGQ